MILSPLAWYSYQKEMLRLACKDFLPATQEALTYIFESVTVMVGA